jgi:hypothetical protein
MGGFVVVIGGRVRRLALVVVAGVRCVGAALVTSTGAATVTPSGHANLQTVGARQGLIRSAPRASTLLASLA